MRLCRSKCQIASLSPSRLLHLALRRQDLGTMPHSICGTIWHAHNEVHSVDCLEVTCGVLGYDNPVGPYGGLYTAPA